jgi:methionyl-tRNA synthetase|tara:strand:+ start:1299 stop:1574 length:276 start_codon:yes stop_codon:yes gene_type:complete
MDNENIKYPKKNDSNLAEDDIVEDLQTSLNEVLSNTSEIMRNLLKSIDSNVTDKKTRDESRDIIKKLFSDLTSATQDAKKEISQAYTYEEE